MIEPRKDDIYSLCWQVTTSGFGYVSSGQVEVYNPAEELRIKNLVYLNPEKTLLGPMSSIVRVKPINGGSELYLCQDGYQSGEDWDWYYEAVKQAWPALLDQFKVYLEN